MGWRLLTAGGINGQTTIEADASQDGRRTGTQREKTPIGSAGRLAIG